MKKGVGMSLEVMVAAALALLVLIVMILIFTGKLQPFTEQSNDCITMGGQCIEESQCGMLAKTPYECSGDKVCCINYCIQDKGRCVEPCVEDDTTACNGKCPENMKRKYSAGCPEGLVCCGSE